MKLCNQCHKHKYLSEFYKNKAQKDGLQNRCKECCKINNYWFRKKRPNYYWGGEGEEGYFIKHYDHIVDYNTQYQKADKIGKIYCIETPCGMYIGHTRRHFHSRLSDHENDWKLNKKFMPKLHSCLDNFTKEESHKYIRDAYILEKSDGERKDLIILQKKWIKHFINQKKIILNTKTAKKL